MFFSPSANFFPCNIFLEVSALMPDERSIGKKKFAVGAY
jgi:hypothetical protein